MFIYLKCSAESIISIKEITGLVVTKGEWKILLFKLLKI